MQDVMRTLDNQARSLQSADPLQLANMLELIEAAIELVDTCNKPGMLTMEQSYGLVWPKQTAVISLHEATHRIQEHVISDGQ